MPLTTGERRLDDGGRVSWMAPHDVGIDAHHVIAHATQLRITLPIRARAGGVVPAIDLDDEPRPGREKVDDEPPDGDLPPEPDPRRQPRRCCQSKASVSVSAERCSRSGERSAA